MTKERKNFSKIIGKKNIVKLGNVKVPSMQNFQHGKQVIGYIWQSSYNDTYTVWCYDEHQD